MTPLTRGPLLEAWLGTPLAEVIQGNCYRAFILVSMFRL